MATSNHLKKMLGNLDVVIEICNWAEIHADIHTDTLIAILCKPSGQSKYHDSFLHNTFDILHK